MKIYESYKVFDKYAEEYSMRFDNQELYEEDLIFFIKNLPLHDGVLYDFACGPGNLTKAMLNVDARLKIHGVDLSPAMINIAKKDVPGADFSVGDMLTFDMDAGFTRGVIIGFGLPYLNSVQVSRLFKRIQSCLTSSGLLFISTMVKDKNDSRWIAGRDKAEEILTHYYESNTLISMLETGGFNVVHSRTIHGDKDEELILVGKRI